MYYNTRGEKVSSAKFKEMYNALKNRQELIKAGLMNRRDLFKMGLLSSAGYLLAKSGLSARAQTQAQACTVNQCASPPTTPFTIDLPIMPVKEPIDVETLSPAPQIAPNRNINPNTGLPFEGRTRNHQAPALGFPFPPPVVYQMVQQENTQVVMSNQLPKQEIWGFDGISPGPTFVSNYGTPILVRNVNNLPVENDGFGKNSVSTHLHNGHTPSESDGFPCDFFEKGQYYDHYYPNVLAGFNSDFPPDGDINESLSTLWYHDHRVSFTAQNVYKGLAGYHLLFNRFDSGNETSGFRLPTFPDFDIPMLFADRCFDPMTGLLFFDTFNLDGILGDKPLVNGVIQPVLHVHPRRYRFRWLNTGPSRFVQIYLTDLDTPSTKNLFWQISNDGNLLPHPVHVEAVALGVAERADVIIDFSSFAGDTLYLENRLEQTSGRGPGPCGQGPGTIKAAGAGIKLLQIKVDLPAVPDHSVDPATLPHFYDLPSTAGTPRVARNFAFNLVSPPQPPGQWAINEKFFNCDTVRFTIKQNSIEHWNLINGLGWSHPIHIHLEEHQILDCAPGLYPIDLNSPCDGPGVVKSRKDVVRLSPGVGGSPPPPITLFFRFRDWLGRYPMHCHNVIHEDHAMMLRWDVDLDGDTNPNP
jgi:FtsP/CotA-like multicopper oxidase with cupredoxin domain